MASIDVLVGDSVPLKAKLPADDSTVFIMAVVRDDTGLQVPGSPFTLTYQGFGSYENDSFIFPVGTDYLTADYQIYDDPGFSIQSVLYGDTEDRFHATIPDPTIFAAIQDIQSNVNILLGRGNPSKELRAIISSVSLLEGAVKNNFSIEGKVKSNSSAKASVKAAATNGKIKSSKIRSTIKDC